MSAIFFGHHAYVCNIPRDLLSGTGNLHTPACSTLILTAHRLSPAKTSRVIHTYKHKRLLFSEARTTSEPLFRSNAQNGQNGQDPGGPLSLSNGPLSPGIFFLRTDETHTREIIRRESRRDFARHAGAPQSRFARSTPGFLSPYRSVRSRARDEQSPGTRGTRGASRDWLEARLVRRFYTSGLLSPRRHTTRTYAPEEQPPAAPDIYLPGPGRRGLPTIRETFITRSKVRLDRSRSAASSLPLLFSSPSLPPSVSPRLSPSFGSPFRLANSQRVPAFLTNALDRPSLPIYLRFSGIREQFRRKHTAGSV